MTIGTLQEAKKLIVTLGLASEVTLSGLQWMETREIVPGTKSQRSWFFEAEESKVLEAMAAAGRHAYLRTPAGMWKFCPLTPRKRAPTETPRAAPTWSPTTTRAGAPEPFLYNWNKETGSWWPEGTQRPTYAQAARGGEAKEDVATVLAAFKRDFQQDMKQEMQAEKKRVQCWTLLRHGRRTM
jgi:hypothetical protein